MSEYVLNSDSVNYEVALEVLGNRLQPFANAIALEKRKSEPSAVFIKYCEGRMAVLGDLRDALRPDDKSTVERILSGSPEF